MAEHGFSFFAADVFFFAAQGFLAEHGLADAFDACGLALHGLHGLAAANAPGALRASDVRLANMTDLMTDCDFMIWVSFE